MGYIYKITNLINNKVYIGKTERTVNKRWKEHVKNAKTDKYQNIILYRAMRKYGIDNFKVEAIDEVSNFEDLDEREIYWINYYQSCGEKGYNATGGGEGGIKVYWEGIEDIIARYRAGERLDLLCKEYHHDYEAIRKALIKMGLDINTFAGPQKVSKAVSRLNQETGEIQTFMSINQAANVLSQETGIQQRGAYIGITRHLNTTKPYKNYIWTN